MRKSVEEMVTGIALRISSTKWTLDRLFAEPTNV